jgi:hypothetical protein
MTNDDLFGVFALITLGLMFFGLTLIWDFVKPSKPEKDHEA